MSYSPSTQAVYPRFALPCPRSNPSHGDPDSQVSGNEVPERGDVKRLIRSRKVVRQVPTDKQMSPVRTAKRLVYRLLVYIIDRFRRCVSAQARSTEEDPHAEILQPGHVLFPFFPSHHDPSCSQICPMLAKKSKRKTSSHFLSLSLSSMR